MITIRGTSVGLQGELLSSGGAACSVVLYYGTTDKNQSTGNWENSLSLVGSFSQGALLAQLTELESNQTYFYRFLASNGNEEGWSDAGSFTTLPYGQGTLRINTGWDDQGLGAGWFWDKGLGGGEIKILEPTYAQTLYFGPDGSTWTLTKAVFSFQDSLTLGSGLEKIILEGTNSLSIQSAESVTIGQNLNGSTQAVNPHLNGGTRTDGYDSFYADSDTSGNRVGQGNLGGYGGGNGPGKGISSGIVYAGGTSGGGGSFGGEGGPGASGAGGMIYGSAGLDVLLGGSGGGLGNLGEAGAGGGALEIIASGKILIEEGVSLSMRGGTVFVHPQFGANFSGGAGSGGAIKLVGTSIENRGVLDVRGGDASGADPREPGVKFLRHSGGAGGGGRIAFISDGTVQAGKTLIDGGKENGDSEAGLPGTLFIAPYSYSDPDELILHSGTLLFDTNGVWSHSSGMSGRGEIISDYTKVASTPYGFGISKFSFSKLYLGPELSVVIQGPNALQILVEGDATIATNLSLNGSASQNGIYSGDAGPGGWSSGRLLRNTDYPSYPSPVLSGMGPGGGIGLGDPSSASGGGSFGGLGGNHHETGNIYGDSNLTHLVGGSGGGISGDMMGYAGGGGGALSLIIGGDFILEENATLSANGGIGISKGPGNSSGGSGGAIRIEAANIQNLGRIEALGGDTNGTGGAGGGGRIALITAGTLAEGNCSALAGSNPDLTEDMQANDGIISIITSPTIPEISEQNLTFHSPISALSLGLTDGLDYNISGLPKGLEIIDLELTGTPEQAGTFTVLVKGANRFGEANNTFTIHVDPGSPSILTLPPTQVGSSSALLHADINSTGGEDANVSFVFGTASDDLSSTSQIVSSSESGKISVLLTGLDQNETYYFRARIENSLSSHEATDLYSFTTLNQEIGPMVRVGPVSNISASGATLSYDLISYDTNAPEITLFWGPVDHGELAGLWSYSHSLGQVSEIGPGTHTISGMAPEIGRAHV